MREYEEMFYNRETQSKIERGFLHTCHHCDTIISYGVYIHDILYCPDCAKEYMLDMDEDTIRDLLEDWDTVDIYGYISQMSIEDIADVNDWDIWED